MGLGVFLGFTVVWGLIGIVLPWFVPKGDNRGIIQVMLAVTAACCYLQSVHCPRAQRPPSWWTSGPVLCWLCTYMAQLNPLFGPQLSNVTLALMKKGWS